MKKILSILFLLCFTVSSYANTYYVSATGNDSNTGLTTSQSWATLSKVNSFFSSLQPGDNVLFNRGDTWYGTLTINKSGNSGNQILIGAYGTGAKPVITGFSTITAWSNLGSNIWESTNAISTLSTCDVVLINGVLTGMGRTPNLPNHYTYQTSSDNGTTSTYNSTDVNAATINWTGADLVIRQQIYISKRATITSASGSALTVSTIGTGTNNYGFFIENDARTLDTQNEWYYNPSTKKLRIYSTSSPTNVQASTIDYPVYNNGFDYITFDNIAVTGGNNNCIYNTGTTNNIIVNACDVKYAQNRCIAFDGGQNIKVQNNLTDGAGKSGVYCISEDYYIYNNTILNSGTIYGMSDNAGQPDAIKVAGSDIYTATPYIGYNVIRNCGSDGISQNHQGGIIEYNWVDSFNLWSSDNGGIYVGDTAKTTKIIRYNIVTNGIAELTNTTQNNAAGNRTVGIYLDEGASNYNVYGNTVAYCGFVGIKIHSHNANAYNNKNDTVYNNTFYSNGVHQYNLQNERTDIGFTGLSIKKNIFFATASGQYILYSNNQSNNTSSMGVLDSNYYVQPFASGNMITALGSALNGTKTLAQWQSAGSQDIHTVLSPRTITDLTPVLFLLNTSFSPVTYPVSFAYIDSKSVNNTTGNITVPAMSSYIGFTNGAVIPPSPPSGGSSVPYQGYIKFTK